MGNGWSSQNETIATEESPSVRQEIHTNESYSRGLFANVSGECSDALDLAKLACESKQLLL